MMVFSFMLALSMQASAGPGCNDVNKFLGTAEAKKRFQEMDDFIVGKSEGNLAKRCEAKKIGLKKDGDKYVAQKFYSPPGDLDSSGLQGVKDRAKILTKKIGEKLNIIDPIRSQPTEWVDIHEDLEVKVKEAEARVWPAEDEFIKGTAGNPETRAANICFLNTKSTCASTKVNKEVDPKIEFPLALNTKTGKPLVSGGIDSTTPNTYLARGTFTLKARLSDFATRIDYMHHSKGENRTTIVDTIEAIAEVVAPADKDKPTDEQVAQAMSTCVLERFTSKLKKERSGYQPLYQVTEYVVEKDENGKAEIKMCADRMIEPGGADGASFGYAILRGKPSGDYAEELAQGTAEILTKGLTSAATKAVTAPGAPAPAPSAPAPSAPAAPAPAPAPAPTAAPPAADPDGVK